MTRYMIIENEELSRINLAAQIHQLRPDWELLATAETVEDSVAFLMDARNSSDIDILFLDIELDDGNCFDIFRELEKHDVRNGCSSAFDIPVIFTTSYNQYAIQAFRLNSVDYLLKPVLEEDLLRAIQKWEHNNRRGTPHGIDTGELLRTLSSLMPQTEFRDTPSPREARRTGSPASRILIPSGDSYSYVATGGVAYFLAEDKAVYVVMSDSGRQRLTCFESLGDVMPHLDESDFFRLSRGVIANIHAVDKVSRYFKGRLQVTLKAGKSELKVTVAATRKAEFLAWYGRY